MNQGEGVVDALVIGAGMCGLSAARELSALGMTPCVVEKSRGVGGRLAGRRMANASFDMGTQHLTGRSLTFAARLQAWRSQGCVLPWFHGGPERADRDLMVWAAQPAMTALARDLGRDLDLRVQHRVAALHGAAGLWTAEMEQGPALRARALICTAPIPQSLALLDAGAFPLDLPLQQRLEAVKYHMCLVVMARLDGPSELPAPGLLEPESGPLLRVVDNLQKGISAVPALTLQATPDFSARWLDSDRNAAAQLMLEAAAPWLGGAVVEWQTHAWRYARPVNPLPEPFVEIAGAAPLLLAGDAFGGDRVEDAMHSGVKAARHLHERWKAHRG